MPDYSKGAVKVTGDATEVLIWAGSTAVGQWAIQLAHISGFRVITTASPKNHQLLKEIGAEDVYDYRDETTPQKIASKYPNLVSDRPRCCANIPRFCTNFSPHTF